MSPVASSEPRLRVDPASSNDPGVRVCDCTSACACVRVCVGIPSYNGLYHSRIHFYRSRRGSAHGVVTLANEASNTMGRGLGRQTSYLLMNVTGI